MGDGAKIGREVLGDASEVGAFSDLGWAWQYDNGVRLATAQSGTGRMAEFDPEVAADGERYVYDYGTGDELLSETRQQAGETVAFEAGDYGRPTSRNGEPFFYDAVGRRLEDDRFVYRWDWRGQLVSVEIKDSWPDGETSPYAGHRIRYDYDARGRLTRRLHEGPAAAGGTRPFVEERRYVWEHDRLAAEAAYGLGETGENLRWRRTYVPGPSGLDDPTQVVVEILQPGSPFSGQARTYTYLRDELGTVVGLVAEPPPGEPVDVLRPPIPVRYLYTPYGEAHAESGPELRRAHFDADAIRAGQASQTIDDPKLAAAGAMVLRWSLPLEPSTLETDLNVERYLAGSGWSEVPRSEYVVAPPPAGESKNAAVLRVLPLAGWTRGATYRVHLGADLRDHLGRPFGRTEDLEWSIPAIPPDAPEDAEPPPIGFDKSFPLRFESYQAASNTLGGRFPTGQSRLFQGLWTDPVTGISYARARWYDARNASWLSEDPMGAVDSTNLYAFVGWQPNMGRDPLGLQELENMQEVDWFATADPEITAHLAARDKAYREWLASMTPEERAASDARTRSRASMVAGIIPGLDTAYDVTVLASERDPLTQEDITTGDRAWAMAGLALPVSGKWLKRGGERLWGWVAGLWRRSDVRPGWFKWTVDPAMRAEDEAAGLIVGGRYIKNPTAANLTDLLTDTGKIGGKRKSGVFMYVVDETGKITIGTRGGRRMPHPTLVGGADPEVLAAGMVDIRGGQIYWVNNASGHFKPGPEALSAAEEAFGQLPEGAFRSDFQGYLRFDE